MAKMYGLMRLGRDAEVKTLPSGKKVANLSLAYNYGQKEGDEYPSQWIDAAFWGTSREASSISDDRMLKRAYAKAGVADFRFHDLCHTWASWHVQSGTPLFCAQGTGRMETLEMVKKYAHLAPEHLAHHANAVIFLVREGSFWQKRSPQTCGLMA